MKTMLVLSLLFPFCLSAQPWNVAKRFSATTGSTVTNNAIAALPDGSAYLVGSLKGTVNFDTVAATGPVPGSTYGYLLKLDTALKPQWVQVFSQKAYHVTADYLGNALIAGAVPNVAQSGDSLSYVAKYSPAGQLLSAFASASGQNAAKIVRTDSAGNCYVAGEISAASTFGALTLVPINAGVDNYLLKLSPDLTQAQYAVFTAKTSGRDQVFDLELGPNGKVFLAGNYNQIYDGSLFGCYCWNGGFYVSEHNAATGVQDWLTAFAGGSGSSTQMHLAVDPSGQAVFAGGSFKHTTTFKTGLSLTAESNDNYHVFIAEMDAGGNVQWARKVILTGDNYPDALVWLDDHLYLNGYFNSTAVMGATILTPAGPGDAFLLQIAAANGAVEGAEQFTGPGTDNSGGLDAGGSALYASGFSSSNNLTIGNFNLSGGFNSVYAARRGNIHLPLTQTSAVTAVSCAGAADGSISVQAQGGAPPYTYSWNNGAQSAMITGLAAGMYTVTISDNAGTQITATWSVAQPTALTASIAQVINAGCKDGGSASLAVSGGTPPYTFAWSNGSGDSTAVDLEQGTYQVTVADAAGCTTGVQVTVGETTDTEPPVISAASATQLALGPSGMVHLTLADLPGAAISDNCEVASLSFAPDVFDCDDLGAQQVAITATDAAGNSASKMISVTVLDTLAPTVICPANIVQCPGDNIVQYDAPVATDNCLNLGGQWNLAEGLPTGSEFPVGQTTGITYTYTDAQGNTGACTFGVTITPAVTIQLDSVVFDGGSETGSIYVTPAGGIAPYHFSWLHNGAVVAEVEDPHNLGKGTYTLELTDANGCSFQFGPVGVGIVHSAEPAWLKGIRLAPNPASGAVEIRLDEAPGPDLQVTVFSSAGQIVFSHLLEKGRTVHRLDCSGWPTGVYMIWFRMDGGSGVRRLVVQH